MGEPFPFLMQEYLRLTTELDYRKNLPKQHRDSYKEKELVSKIRAIVEQLNRLT